MKLASHGTGGARRRERWHCREHRPIECPMGQDGGGVVFRVEASDGRTYQVRLSAGDVDELMRVQGRQRGFPFL